MVCFTDGDSGAEDEVAEEEEADEEGEEDVGLDAIYKENLDVSFTLFDWLHS